MHDIIGFNTVLKRGNIFLISCLQFVNEMFPVYFVFLYEHLLVNKFELS